MTLVLAKSFLRACHCKDIFIALSGGHRLCSHNVMSCSVFSDFLCAGLLCVSFQPQCLSLFKQTTKVFYFLCLSAFTFCKSYSATGVKNINCTFFL